jgi:succinate dehydrogenase / fumarate reductase cytochrome b subunit
MALDYAYYPGCASREITKEADRSTRSVAAALGIKLHDMPRANCCGAGLVTDYDKELWLALNARIFAQAEQMGMDILTICSTCLMVMNTANKRLTDDPAQLARTNKTLAEAGLKYSGNVKIKHLLWVLVDDFGLSKLKAKVIKPLDYLKIAAFYGCHTLRPSDALGFDDPEKPHSLDIIIKTLGAKSVDYVGKTKCCGFQVDLVTEETAIEMTGTRVLEAKDEGADCMVTPCPFCHTNLDSYQKMAEKQMSKKMNVPVFHLAQLVGLALGMDAGKLGLSRNMVSPEAILK